MLTHVDGIVMNLVLCSDIEVWRGDFGRGGVAVHIYELSRSLIRLGNSVSVLQPSISEWKREVEDNLTIISVPCPSLKGLGALNYNSIIWKKLQTLIDQNLVDAIQFHNLTGLMTYHHMKNLPIPTWTKCHGIRDLYIKNLELDGHVKIKSFIYDSAVANNVSRLCYKLSHHNIANSKSTMENLVHYYGLSPRRISVVYNGVNHQLFNPRIDGETIKNKLGIQSLKVVLYVGDFSLLKGVCHLILSFIRVVQKMSSVCLLLVGGYGEDSYFKIKELIRQAGIGKHIKIIGFIPYLELPKYYAAADLCVVPSFCEPFGNVALEAMASGKPVVASKVGGLKEFVDERAGIFVNPGDINGLAQSMLCLLRTPEIRFEMGKNAVKHSMGFSWKRTAEETLIIAQRLEKQG